MSSTEAQKLANKKYRSNYKFVNVRLDPIIYEKLFNLACERSLTVTEIIREMISYHVEG